MENFSYPKCSGFFKKKRNLLYLASGNFSTNYDLLSLDKIYLVDRNFSAFKHQKSINNRKNNSFINFHSDGSKSLQILGIERDAFPAIDILKKNNVKIDYLVSINEGLEEGNGSYPIFTDILMGYLSPVLNEEIILIYDPSYYTWNYGALRKLDWGYKKTEDIKSSNCDYIPPVLFAPNLNPLTNPGFGNIIGLKKIRSEKMLNFGNLNNTKISVKLCSIWDDEDNLNMIGINLINNFPLKDRPLEIQDIHTVKDFMLSKNKVYNINGKNIKEIIEYAERNNLKHIGLCPWMNGRYEDVIAFLRNLKTCKLDSITFYHLNRNDYKQFYLL
jgi:hypothetical protein